MRIDHVIYATADLDATAARVQDQLGLPVVGGGRHDQHGTQNRIVPLGGGYLELLGLADADQAATSPFGQGLLNRLAGEGDGWLAWVVAVDDVDPVAARLGTPVTILSRRGLSARLTGVAEAMNEPLLPFFVARDPEVADPGVDGDAGGITGIDLAGDIARLDHWLGGASLPISISKGAPALRAVRIGDRTVGPKL